MNRFDQRKLFLQILELILPVSFRSKFGEGALKSRVIPPPGDPRAKVYKPKRSKRLYELQGPSIKITHLFICLKQDIELAL